MAEADFDEYDTESSGDEAVQQRAVPLLSGPATLSQEPAPSPQ
eukprot:COSAG01_NODE_9336_length_2480_cov_2.217976_1_plen_42_part_10